MACVLWAGHCLTSDPFLLPDKDDRFDTVPEACHEEEDPVLAHCKKILEADGRHIARMVHVRFFRSTKANISDDRSLTTLLRYDFVTYPFGIFSSTIISQLNPNDSLVQNIGYGTVVNCFYLPGCIVGGLLMDWIGRKQTMTLGFACWVRPLKITRQLFGVADS